MNDIFDGWKIKMYLNNSETKKKLLMVYLKSFYCHFICIMCLQHEENVFVTLRQHLAVEG